MCLIVQQEEGTVWEESFLQGVYNKNKDGIGVMYTAGNVLYSAKQVPKNFTEYLAFYRQHIEGKSCAWHSRLQTHGPIEIKNAHPHVVLGAEDGYPLQLIHNGILHTDNLEDQSQTDTALYIKNYLRPMLLKNPEFFMTEAFKEIIGEHIGRGNRFVLLDAYGNRVTVNEDTGVQYNGAWLSNTYAWDTTGTEHGYKGYSGRNAGPKWNPYADMYNTDDAFWESKGVTKVKPLSLLPKGDDGLFEFEPEDDETLAEVDDFYDALMDACLDAHLVTAEHGLRYSEVQAYFLFHGEDAWTTIEMISQGYMDDAEVLEEIRSVMEVPV